jgi:hypothetical protein
MKNKIAKVLGVVLAAMMVVSVFAFVAPVSAVTPQTWAKQALPSASGYVMPNNILQSGPVAQDSATGTLYTFVQTGMVSPLNFSILKSTNNGRTWAPTGTVGQPTGTVTAIKVYQSIIYYSQGTFLFKSTDGGVTFLQIANVSAVAVIINSIDVATLAGRNIDVMGTNNGVYYTDESIPFFTAAPVGSIPLTTNILAVAASPNFATDRALAAIDSAGVVNMIDFGGTWNQLVGSSPAIAAMTAASIAFTSDFNISTNPGFYFGLTAAGSGTLGGVYAFRGNTGPGATSTTLLLTGSSTSSTGNVSSLSVIGTYAAATIYAGIVDSSSKSTQLTYSTNSGVSWSSPKKLLGPAAAALNPMVYVLLDRNFAAATPSSMVFALVGGAGLSANDQSGFSYSVDKGVSYNQISLINDSIQVINDLNATNGLTYVSTSSNTSSVPTPLIPAVAGTFTVTAGSYQTVATPALYSDYATFTSTGAGSSTVILGNYLGSFTVTTTGGATWNAPMQLITFTGVGQTARVTANTMNTVFSAVINNTALVSAPVFTTLNTISAGTVAVTNGSGTVVGTGTSFLPYMVGSTIQIAANLYTVTAVNSPTNLTVSPVISTATAAGLSYILNYGGDFGGGSYTGLDPVYQVTLDDGFVVSPTPIVYNTAATDTVVTLSPAPTALQAGAPTGTGFTYNATSGIITFNAVGGAATFTATANWAATTATATYNTTAGAVLVAAPKLSLNGATPQSWTSSGTTWPGGNVTLTFAASIAAFIGNARDSIWRTDGTTSVTGTATTTNFERVFVGPWTILPNTIPSMTVTWGANTVVPTATIVRVSSAFATDNTVVYSALGAIYLTYSADKGQTWSQQSSAIGSANLTVDRLSSLVVASSSTQYVGSNSASGGQARVVRTTSNGVGNVLSPAWSEALLTASNGTTPLIGVVSSINVASNGDILAAVLATAPSANTFVCLSKATATNFVTSFAGLVDPNTGNTDATLNPSPSGALVAAAADYATTGNIFVTLYAGGVYRYSATGTGTAAGWLQVDNNAALPPTTAYDANGGVVRGTGLVVTAGGPGSSAEGSGMVYATDSSAATQGVSRIRGLSTQAEALLSPTGITFTGLWASSSALANVQLWTIGSDLSLYTYVDTLNVAGTGVSFVVSSTTATITFPTLLNATSYVAFVNTTQQKTLYTAGNTALITVSAPVVSTDGKTATVAVTGLTPNTLYYASVWANAPVSSFMYTSATSFTTALSVPTAPIGLVPAPGSLYVMTVMSFSWNPVVGATSYELWLDTKADFSTASKYTGILNNSFTPPAALANNTLYYWQVRAVNSTGVSAWNGVWTFTTVTVTVPPVTVTSNPVPTIILTATSNPVPTIIISQQPPVTVTQAAPAVITLTQPSYTLVTPTAETPSYIWIIVGVGALLTLAVIILIIRTRRVV